MLSEEFKLKSNLFYGIFLLYLLFIIGFRYEIGPDWDVYNEIFESSCQILDSGWQATDPLYIFLNCVVNKLSLGIYFVNFICALIVVCSSLFVARLCYDRCLYYVLSLPYFIYVVSMGYTRQSVAISLFSMSVCVLVSDRYKVALALQAVAFTFHKSVSPYAILTIFQRTNKYLFWLAILPVFTCLSIFYLPDYYEYLKNQYVSGDFSSDGASFRVAFSLICSSFFLCIIRQKIESKLREILTIFCYLPLLYMLILILHPDLSTAIDRIALYQLPINSIILSYVPSIFIKKYRFIVKNMIFAVSLTIFFTWVSFSSFREAWEPYKSYLLS